MNGELLTALERIEREKGISKEILFEAIESALASAARKVIDDPDISKEDITVNINKETGKIEIFAEGEEVKSARFGRIAAQTAKQVMIQKIREAERDVVYAKYTKKVGIIISGSVHRFEKGKVIVELDDTEAILPRSGQIPRERFRQGEVIRAYLLKVDRETGAPEIILSRTDEGFVKKLFELEVPEISQGIVEIKAMAREAGERTKVAVCSKDEKVDPVGACVGMRGSRVRDIVKELHGERIDIVRWNDDIREYLPAAVSPAEIIKMVIDRAKKSITLTVPRDQLALLIGKKGRNIRLASKLLDWELIAESAEEEKEKVLLSDISGVGKKVRVTLEEAGYNTARELSKASVEDLSGLSGIGPKTAEKILAASKKALALKKEADLAEKEKAIFPEIAPEEKDNETSEPGGEKAEEKAEEEEKEEALEEEEKPAEGEIKEETPEEEEKPAEEEIKEETPEEEEKPTEEEKKDPDV
ncbi:MAG: transcription termination factor NusA [Candidatus Omnitrophota bacterium]